MKLAWLTGLALLMTPAGALAQDDEMTSIVSTHGNIRIAAQPEADELQTWIDDGTTLVISVRTQREMSELDFDEGAMLQDAGIAYANIPMGYELGYSPEGTSALSAVLNAHDGPVVLHCTIGYRAAHVYVAHLIETGTIAPDEANSLNLSPRGDLNAEVMRELSPIYAEAYPEE